MLKIEEKGKRPSLEPGLEKGKAWISEGPSLETTKGQAWVAKGQAWTTKGQAWTTKGQAWTTKGQAWVAEDQRKSWDTGKQKRHNEGTRV